MPAGEINDRPILGVSGVLVVLLHVLVLMRLLDPNTQDKISKPLKVVEVVLLKPEPVVLKEESKPPLPKPALTKPVTPKKSPPKPKPVVKKETPPKVAKKTLDTKPTPKADFNPPILTSPLAPSATPSVSAPVSKPSAKSGNPSAQPSAKPAAKTGSGNGGNSGVVAISRVKPSYPARAASRHIEGWVKIEFTVTATGSVSNPSVVSGSPPGIFDEAGLAAIRRWRFKPRMVNGAPTSQRAVQTLKFTLSN